MNLKQRLENGPVYIHVCKDGTVTYRTKNEKIFNDVALPVFSVPTKEDAENIQVALCRKQYIEHPLMPGKPWYKLNEFSGELDDLERVGQLMESTWKSIKSVK